MQEADDRVSDRLLVARGRPRPGANGRTAPTPWPLLAREGSAIGPLREPLEATRRASGLRPPVFGLDPAVLLGDDPELVLDGAEGRLAGTDPAGLGQVDRLEPRHLGLGGGVPVLGADEIERRVAPEEPGLGALVPEVAGILAARQVGDVLEVAPEPIQLAPAGVVEYQLIERPVVAEVAGHAMEAGAQQAARIPLLAIRAEENSRPFRDDEGVGEGPAETRR